MIGIVISCDPGTSEPGEPIPDVAPLTTPAVEPGRPVLLDSIEVSLIEVSQGLDRPLFLTHAGDGSGRLFVVEQEGRVRVLRDNVVLRAPFLDVSESVSSGGERGLLGLAFPPDYAATGRFYVNYTDARGGTVIARFLAQDPSSDEPVILGPEILLRVAQPYSNHNGGCIMFGPDGMLWVGTGDGGSGGDPDGHSQNPKSLLGKMLRLDVSGEGPPAIPDGNPGARRGSEFAPEVYQSGLRNPWRFSFDRTTGDLWITDVGQNSWEEINFIKLKRAARANFGWNLWEGTHPFPANSNPGTEGFVFPVVEYGRNEGKSITGGYVYRGSNHPVLEGVYVYADYVDGWVGGLRLDETSGGDEGSVREERVLVRDAGAPASFGEDEDGELYLVDHGGKIYRIAARLR
jgi:glucose/arabinose dehydrogenase